jgi:hypothetical protein
LLEANAAVEPIRQVIRGRLMDAPTIDAELKRLTKMLGDTRADGWCA